ncbi:MAG: DUF4012 domain-containing protein [Chloroflexota bacterium]|nr:DUF4012 domain-containing protein [Chloroflexota bacterium]
MIEQHSYGQTTEKGSSPGRIGCGLLVGLLLLFILFAAAKGIRTLPAAQGALDDLRVLQGIDLGSMSELDGETVREFHYRLAKLEANLATIDAEISAFLPLTRHMGWLPQVGDEARASSDMLELGLAAATAGRAAMEGALPVLEAFQEPGEGSSMARVVSALDQAESSWAEADAALSQVAAARTQLDLNALDPRLSDQIQRLDDYLPLLDAGIDLARAAPGLFGGEEARTYLLLAQNSEELRPTGGFISGVGFLKIDGGELSDLDFEDSHLVYSADVDHPPAPSDLETYMQAEILLFRDANWSPDFPTSAVVAQALYQLNRDELSDGVIAFDMEAARLIVDALAPLELPGYEEPVTGENLITAMRTIWASPFETESTIADPQKAGWWYHRKDFMSDLAGAARSKVESGQADLGQLARALYTALEEKHILISLNDRAGADLLARTGWDGSLQPGDGDYLLVVDSNVGWNKVNTLVDREVVTRVTPGEAGIAQVVLDITYTHRGEPGSAPCVHESRYGDSYEDMIRRCYFNYIRVYVPGGATLQDSSGFEPGTVTSFPGEHGTTVLAGFVVLPPGQEHQVRLQYELPAGTIGGDRYDLRVQKQPGTPSWPVTVMLTDSQGDWQLVEPESGLDQDENTVLFWLASDTDLSFERVR